MMKSRLSKSPRQDLPDVTLSDLGTLPIVDVSDRETPPHPFATTKFLMLGLSMTHRRPVSFPSVQQPALRGTPFAAILLQL